MSTDAKLGGFIHTRNFHLKYKTVIYIYFFLREKEGSVTLIRLFTISIIMVANTNLIYINKM